MNRERNMQGGVSQFLNSHGNNHINDVTSSEIYDLAEALYDDMLDDLIMSICFDIHRKEKLLEWSESTDGPRCKLTGAFEASTNHSQKCNEGQMPKQTKIEDNERIVLIKKRSSTCISKCPKCGRSLDSLLFAKHLSTCIGNQGRKVLKQTRKFV